MPTKPIRVIREASAVVIAISMTLWAGAVHAGSAPAHKALDLDRVRAALAAHKSLDRNWTIGRVAVLKESRKQAVLLFERVRSTSTRKHVESLVYDKSTGWTHAPVDYVGAALSTASQQAKRDHGPRAYLLPTMLSERGTLLAELDLRTPTTTQIVRYEIALKPGFPIVGETKLPVENLPTGAQMRRNLSPETLTQLRKLAKALK